MPTQNTAIVLLAVLALLWILFQQLRAKPVRERNAYRVTVVLAVVGLYQLAQVAGKVQIPATAYAALLIGLGSGAVLGWVRGRLVHVWRQDGQLFRQGNWLTVVLWIAGLAVHLGLDQVGVALAPTSQHGAAAAAGLAGILLYLGVALAAQRFATLRRGSLRLQPV
ncbi:MAG: hypothetical protein M3017_04395 [Actinomycetota bacterium]|nr:hypothetical protein [Actinomycetota bacterium]